MSDLELNTEAGSSEMTASERETMFRRTAEVLGVAAKQVKAAVSLLDEGNTVPFIARYRKEMTGELDENQLRDIEESVQYARGLHVRKQEVLRIIDEQGKLTEELKRSILEAVKLQQIEDLYRPFRQKRKTRASVAKEKGLEPLAEWLLSQPVRADIDKEAARYISEDKGVASAEEALGGALDIVAEQLADDAKIRAWVRTYTLDHAILATEAKDASAESVYEMYYSYRELAKKMPPHRILAINRGERENVLKVALETDSAPIIRYISKRVIKGSSPTHPLLERAIEDAYKRLIAPSIEREVRSELTEKGDAQAISIFAGNLRSLLLQPPVRGKRVLGVDPAFRTGCKLAALDETGKLLEVAVTYPTPPRSQVREASEKFSELVEKYDLELIVIGNGTASRETEQFVADWIAGHAGRRKLAYLIVNEAGASVYSASKIAQEEFPDMDAAERSAASIARRVQDPLAELVKIDPKAIGVGQYQHDVSQKQLEGQLKAVVESAVNHVGVDVNTASPSLLSYVAGINQTTARNIVKYRNENGSFSSRAELKKVPRLGAKTLEQCAGFLRIEGTNPLDRTPIHPESYKVVDRLFAELKVTAADLGTVPMREALEAADVQALADKLEVGLPTLKDIIESLLRPGRDPREELPAPIFRTDVLKIEDLKPGMELQGTVRNVIDFGAFVDIGIKSDGLVHISQLSSNFVKHPMDVVAVGDTVTVWVLNVDLKKGRVGLTMRGPVENG
ncbi:RNA-binding transcriptional accessory protein [Saccharibacillus kuerlensis]|uniref:RNA-binding transcriptional accessory protein n=2 Tax=Saccharibacillus kuerlensis TaxID=459527 RepID=A0ABQ2L435_9BACL|nr:RNA-binding transcriptional accessory protein [Saccharibacillus kuerlensis]